MNLQNEKPLLEVENLSISFLQYTSGLRQRKVNVISDLSVDVNPGEIVAIVGSSGSGKSLLAHAIFGILPSNSRISGNIKYNGRSLDYDYQKRLRGKEMFLIPQSVNYLDPLMKVGKQITTAIQGNYSKDEKNIILRDILKKFNLDEEVAKMYPFQLSGGMTRRILISCALVSNAKLIVADEPTPGLDIESAKETLDNLRKLADEGCGVILITHDIDISMKIADKIAVFYGGTTLEIAPTKEFDGTGNDLRHPYSKALFKALPQNEFKGISGFQPSHFNRYSGCLFADRCEMCTSECLEKNIDMRDIRGGKVRCIHAK
ncbi:MAG: ABC transporter ATP-binding protein [Clostridium butyricum]|nr:ABC transporter ATP-binding protein [Clostridium butyricum]